MRKTAVALFALTGSLLVAPAPAAAHHSAAMFDETKRVEVKGTVVQWVWANPHCLLQVETKGEDGETVRWVAETSNPLDMTNRGWKRGDFKPGDVVTVTLRPAKGGQPLGNIVQVQSAAGRIWNMTNPPAAPARQ